MEQNFEKLLEDNLSSLNLRLGELINAVIIDIDKDWVTLHTGLKSESLVARSEFIIQGKDFNYEVGEEIELLLEKIDDGTGNTRLSRIKAIQERSWNNLGTALKTKSNVKGYVLEQIKGGFAVEVGGLRAFLPGSLVENYVGTEMPDLSGQDLEFKVIKLDKLRKNIVLSRKAVVNAVSDEELQVLISKLKEGGVVRGTVKTITDYGAFIDLGGIDGLVHITDISWRRIKHPTDVLSSNTEIDVLVLHFDEDTTRVSLGLKQLSKDPWETAVQDFPLDSVVEAAVTNITDFGCFAELAEGVEGLIHVSELDWGNRNINPKQVLKIGAKVKVKVLTADFDKKRLSLSVKQCTPNPWKQFNEKYEKGDVIVAPIRSITDFGIFIGLTGNIDGLIHITDIPNESRDDSGILKSFKKNDEVTSIITGIDVERERISLSIKSVIDQRSAELLGVISKGDVVKVTIEKILKNAIDVTLSKEVKVRIRAVDLPKLGEGQTFEDVFSVDSEVEALVKSIQVMAGKVRLSIRDLEVKREREVLSNLNKEASEDMMSGSIGDLIKEQRDKKDNE